MHSPIDTKKCPFCQEVIRAVAVKCRHCGELLGDNKSPGIWRDGKLLVMSRKIKLPARCVKSNAPATTWLKRQYKWHQGGMGMAILQGALISSLIAEKIKIQVPLSDEWTRRRRRAILIGWLSAVIGLALIFVGIASANRRDSALVTLIPIGFLVMMAGSIYGAVRAQVVRMAKANSTHLWLKGVHRDYLATLPTWPRDL
jgi:hypothetical protein